MKTIITIIFVSCFTFFSVQAQELTGYIKTKIEHEHHHDDEECDGEIQALPGANVYWAGTTQGTATDDKGFFSLKKNVTTNLLVISFTGYQTDTLEIAADISSIEHTLKHGTELEEVTVTRRTRGEYYSVTNPISMQVITEAGLQKLPCCDLSESFENNASVDVTFTDAVSGAKQIQMLGLAGIYSQIMRENIPDVRGLSANYGLTYLPGSWVESIQISKGASTVTRGYESITGQINAELKKPETGDRFFLNLYGNSEARLEANVVSAHQLSDEISTIFMLHASQFKHIFDEHGDGFLDMPLYDKISGINRWKYYGKNGMESQIGIRFLNENRQGGQTAYINNPDQAGTYGIDIGTAQYELYGKLGFPIPGSTRSSLGTVYSFSVHRQNSIFGNNIYSGIQKSFFGNAIFNTSIIDEAHSINAGGSFTYDEFDETLNETDFLRTEKVPGIFAEYNFNHNDRLNLILGIRSDFHNLYGTFVTPRFHSRYEVSENFIVRASAGKGYRTANILAENMGILASSRRFIIKEELQPEQAWNYGVNFTMMFDVGVKQSLTLNMDFYRTDFVNQIIADIDYSPREISFYNLAGESYSNSFQTDLSYQPSGRFSVNAAFRYTDVKTTMHGDLIPKPFVNKYRALLTGSYATWSDKWAFDVTNQFVGTSPLPDMQENPEPYQLKDSSPAYYILHFQITRKFERLELYAGVENATNYVQSNPIIAADDPFGEYFDASMIWGPLLGRAFYAGLRFTIH